MFYFFIGQLKRVNFWCMKKNEDSALSQLDGCRPVNMKDRKL